VIGKCSPSFFAFSQEKKFFPLVVSSLARFQVLAPSFSLLSSFFLFCGISASFAAAWFDVLFCCRSVLAKNSLFFFVELFSNRSSGRRLLQQGRSSSLALCPHAPPFKG